MRERLGVRYDAARVREVAEQAIRAAVQTKDNPVDLINVALEELVRLRCELPGYTTPDTMAAGIWAEVNGVLRYGRRPGRTGLSGRGWSGCWWWTRRRGVASSTGSRPRRRQRR